MDDLERFENALRYQHEGYTKYVYFLLAAAAAGIALAMNMTASSIISWSQVPLGFSVVFWGLSFYAGCRCAFWRNVMFGLDATRLINMNNVSVSETEQIELN